MTRPSHQTAQEPSSEKEHFKNKMDGHAFRLAKFQIPSGPGGLAEGIIGPVAVEPGDAPLDALAKAGKTGVLDDREMHGTHLAVAQHDVSRAIAARNIVGLPRTKGGFVEMAMGRDRE